MLLSAPCSSYVSQPVLRQYVLATFRSAKHRVSAMFAMLVLTTIAPCFVGEAFAGFPSKATTTTLTVGTIAAPGTTITTIASGTPITLTATVLAGASPATLGVVNFCDASATTCTGVHRLGTAQVTATGIATLRFVPNIGTHSYSAILQANRSYLTSTSSAATLSVTGSYASSATILATGTSAGYTLTGSVTGSSPVAPAGLLSFLDASNSNASITSATLSSSASTFAFTGSTASPVAIYPSLIIIADFNGDGINDAVVDTEGWSTGNSTITLFLGKGDGTFLPNPFTLSTVNVQSWAIGDFNGDGLPDLAVGNDYASELTILLNNGNGGFTQSASHPAVGQASESMVVGDFNNDGLLDLLVTDYQGTGVTVLLGTGTGTFTAGTPIKNEGSGTHGMAVGDFNGDGNLDFVQANESGFVQVYLGAGDGTFQKVATTTATGSGPYGMVVGDFNGDGKMDLAVASSPVSILLGKGDGTFTAAASPATASGPFIALGDINGDGIPDLGIVNSIAGTSTVLIGRGDGTFTPQPISIPAGFNPFGIAIGDLNQDGIPDVLLASNPSPAIAAFLTSATATSTATVTGVTLAGAGTHNVLASIPVNTVYGATHSATTPLQGMLVSTAISLVANPVSSVLGQQIALVATLAPYNNATVTTNTETVTFYNGATSLGTGMLNAGVASLNVTSLPVGVLSLIAVYGGDTTFAASTSNPLSYTVIPVATLGQTVTESANLVFTTAGTIASITGPYPSDFSMQPGGTCKTGDAHLVGDLCTVLYSFTPTSPWTREGGIVLTNSSGAVLANTYLSGVGNGPQIAYPGAVLSDFISGVDHPAGLAVDGSGNIFIANSNPGDTTIVEYPATCTSYQCQVTIASSFNQPGGLAFDGSGNLWVADTQHNAVKELIASGGRIQANPVIRTWTGFAGPTGIAVDHFGNVYVADSGSGNILEMSPINGVIPATGPITILVPGFTTPTGVAVDASGNVYVADSGTGAVSQIPIGCINSACLIKLSSTYYPYSVAVDPLGNVYVANISPNDTVQVIQAVNGVIPINPTITSYGYASESHGMTLDTFGNVYVSSTFQNSVEIIARQRSTSLIFPATQVGTTSPPLAEVVQNIGNQPLTIGTLYLSPGFNAVSGQHACSTGATVPSGQACLAEANFAPTNVTLTAGSLQFLTNANVVPYIPLIGTGVALTPSTLLAPTLGVAYTQTVKMSGGYAPYHYAVSSGSMPAGLVLDPLLGTITGIPTGGGPFTFSVTATDSSSTPITVQNSYTFTVPPPTIALLPVASPFALLQIGVPFSQTFTASGGTAPFTFAATGLPAGLALSPSGVLSGIPTQAGTVKISITATDASTGTGPYSQTKVYNAVVAPPMLVIPATVPDAVVGTAYSQNLGMTGGTAPYLEIISAGNLPAGLTLSSTGLLNGKPVTGGGPYTFTVTATDSSTGTGAPFIYVQSYTMSVTPFPVAFASPTAVNFATIPANTTSNTWTVTLNNTSPTPMLITSFVLSDAVNFTQTNNCGTVLAGYSNCNIILTFVPKTTGTFTGTLTINDSAQVNPQTVALTGTSTSSAPTVVVSPASLAFADVAVGSTGNAQTVTVSNTGATPLLISGISSSDQTDLSVLSSCGTTLAPYSTCNLLVALKPQTTGPLTSTLTVTDNASPTTQTVSMTGNGLSNAPTVVVSPSSLTFASVPLGSTGNPQTITVNNTGSTPLLIASILPSDQTDFVLASSCNPTLAAHTTCNLTVALKPQATGAITGTLTVTDNANPTTQVVTLTGNGLSNTPTVVVSPSSLTFASVPLGSTGNPQTVTVSNTGATPLLISSVVPSDQVDFVIASSCNATLAPYSTCNVTIALKPQTLGAISGTLIVNDNASPATQTVLLTGTGASGQPTASYTPSGIPFASQVVGTTSTVSNVVLTNTSLNPLAISGITLTDVVVFKFTSNCGTTLAPGATCMVGVTFTPQTANTFTGSLTITDNAASGPQVVTLSGTATSNIPTVMVTPTTLPFGTQNVGDPSTFQVVTINNTSLLPLDLSTPVLSDTQDYTFSNKCPTVLAAGLSCNVTVYFAPLTAGPLNGTLTLHDNTQLGVEVINLVGSGNIAPSSIQFNQGSPSAMSTTVGTSTSQQVLLYNAGTAVLKGINVSISDTTNYSVANYCVTSQPGAYCFFELTFNPTGPGTFPATITVTASNSTPATATVTSTASLPGASGISISVNPTALSLKVGQTGSAAFTMTPTNGYKGSVALTCGGLPTGVTCQFAPATMTADGSNTVQTAKLTVNTSGLLIGANRTASSRTSLAAVFSLSGLWMGLLMIRRRKSPMLRSMRIMLPMSLLAALAATALIGCGSGAIGAYTAVGNHTVTVTATGTASASSSSATVVQTANFTLTITQ